MSPVTRFRPAGSRLFGAQSGGGRLDAVLFATLARQASSALQAGIYLRERELSYLGVEDWDADWFGAEWDTQVPPGGEGLTAKLAEQGQEASEPPAPRYRLVSECIRFRGEIPCLYLVKVERIATASRMGLLQLPSDLDLSFLALVDFVSGVAGTGVGLTLREPMSHAHLTTTNFQSGRRVRYRMSLVPGRPNASPVYWVERGELGQGRGGRRTGGLSPIAVK